jgi:hypothetical protein
VRYRQGEIHPRSLNLFQQFFYFDQFITLVTINPSDSSSFPSCPTDCETLVAFSDPEDSLR